MLGFKKRKNGISILILRYQVSVVVEGVGVDVLRAICTEIFKSFVEVVRMDYAHVCCPNLVADQRDVDSQLLEQL